MTYEEHNRVAQLILSDFNDRLDEAQASPQEALTLMESVIVSLIAHVAKPDSHCEVCGHLFESVHARLHLHFDNHPSTEYH